MRSETVIPKYAYTGIFVVKLLSLKGLGQVAVARRGARGGVVVKVTRYKPAGRGFNSRWCQWNFSVT
jgi:hypothetical protein